LPKVGLQHFKLLFDVDMANFEVDRLTSPYMMSSSMTLIWKPKYCVPMDFLSVAWKRRLTFSYIPSYNVVAFMVILWLTSQLGHVLFNSIFNISLDYVVLFVLSCLSLWFFIHAWFPSISIKTCQSLNKHILVIEGDTKLFEFALKSMDENHLQYIRDFTQFWCTPKLLNGLNYKSRSEDNGRNWGILFGS
jgi:hypothetical protein